MVFQPEEQFLEERCTGCGICSSVCPASAISVDGEGKPESFSSHCINCGHCGCYCPSNCFSLEPDMDDKTPLKGDIDSLFQSRRSTRSFKDRELTDSELREVLEPLNWTPTGRNSQKVRVDVIRGRERIEKLILKPFLRVLRLVDCFRLVTLLAGSERSFINRLKEGDDLITWGAPCVVLFHTSWRSPTPSEDSLIAASSVALKAESMGIGSLWSGVIKVLSPVIGLGKYHAVLLIGFPGLRKYQHLPARSWTIREL